MKSKMILAASAALALNMGFALAQDADEEAKAKCMEAATIASENEDDSFDPEAFCNDKDRVADMAGTNWDCIIDQLQMDAELGMDDAMAECN